MHTVHVVLGPTASGKTDYSIRLAHTLGNAEIVNADSRQLYKLLDIGTAKVPSEEMQGIAHHLLNVLDPSEEVTVGWYQRAALKVIDDIHQRGNIPILVGGSMLYLSAIIDDLALATVADPLIRERLMKEYERDHGKTLHARLQELDPESASVIHQNNKPHLIRSLEICALSNAPKSSLLSRSDQKYQFEIVGMEWDRPLLHERINARTKQMLESGWIGEVESLMENGYTESDPGMKSHGYKEIMQYIQNGKQSSLDELCETIAAKSRQYAKRQLTWWRGDSRIRWIEN